MNFHFYLPTNFYFGAGSLNRLRTLPMPGKHALIVTTRGGSIRRYGYLDALEAELTAANIAWDVFSDVGPNPTVDNVMDGSRAARACGSDFLVALGGGSAIDAAKAIAAMAVNDGNYWEYVRSGTGGGRQLMHQPLPVIAIPTTAGTGSEADAGCVISNPQSREKIGCGWAFPVISIIDPALMSSVPPMLTAYQGFDVLSHGIECFLSRKATPITDALALDAVRRVAESLPEAVHNGANLDARTNMAAASLEAGYCLTGSSLTAQHSLEHALSGTYENLPHGAGLILLSRAYLTRCAAQPCYTQRLCRLCEAMQGAPCNDPIQILPALEKLLTQCGVDSLTMHQFGIARESLPDIAQRSVDARYDNERCPTTAADGLKILLDSVRRDQE